MRPENTIARVTRSAWTMPLAIVAADREREERADEVQDRREGDRHRGGIARVEIEVATALAVSWKPLVKSKASAVPTTIQRTTSFMP